MAVQALQFRFGMPLVEEHKVINPDFLEAGLAGPDEHVNIYATKVFEVEVIATN